MPTTMDRVNDHYKEALDYFAEDRIVGIFLQGSQNYGLQIPGSDVDTKLIVTPTFEEIAMNRQPVSTTHIRANEEHIDFKDIRLYVQTFRKQNLNFLEILFTDYKYINPMYEKEWKKLIANREKIARMNPVRAVQSMKGIAMEKYHAMKHEYPSKVEVLKIHGYDPKQLHHLLRVEEFLGRYMGGERYEDCLRPLTVQKLVDVKLGLLSLPQAEKEADRSKARIEIMSEQFRKYNQEQEDPEALEILHDVQLNIMRTAISEELTK